MGFIASAAGETTSARQINRKHPRHEKGAWLVVDYAALAELMVAKCSGANSEMTVAARIEEILRDALKELGVEYEPTREQRVIQRGRIDSLFGAVVTEYKKEITSQAEWDKHTQQLVDYIEQIAPDPAFRDEHLGIVTDGKQIRFVLFDGGVAKPETPAPIDAQHLRRWVESLATLRRRGLRPQNLVDDFAVVDAKPDGFGRKLALACYNALGQPTKKTGMLRTEWQRLFAQSVDHRKTPKAHLNAYRKALGLPPKAKIDPTRALFALQTTYAIILKLVALRVLSEMRLQTAAIRFHELSALDSDHLRQEMERLENGHLLRDLQIENLLEGDFFAWYADPAQWSEELYEAIKGVIVALADYEGRGPVLKPGVITDVFRQLYQRIIPPEIRHDLGEYYTPRWLAQATINAIPKAPGWKGLDPCAGSGTFIVEMIALVLSETAGLTPDERLSAVLTRVMGIDLNPLAVLTSRVNYLLAISALLEQASPDRRIEIPVYLGDAAYVPKLTDLDGVPALTYKITTDLGPLEFSLPVSLAKDPQRLGAIMLEVENAVIAKDTKKAEDAILNALDSQEVNPTVEAKVQALIENLMKLEDNEWDRIWARIIKNYLATAAIGPFDFAVGNPPWVEWKDLPNGYRETIKSLCRQRGLFSDDKYSGGTDLNISVLIAHTVLEQWVKPEGYLAFLMPRVILQLRSTQGFRRWKLPDGSPISLHRLDDWSSLQPFEGASTSPTGYLLKRSAQGPQMVPVTFYRSIERREAGRSQGATWLQAEQTLQKEDQLAVQVGSNGAPYLIDEASVIPSMTKLLGRSAYRGRRATETAPHSIYWFRYISQPQPGRVLVENDQNPRARNRVPRSRDLLETTHLYPMLRGGSIRAFGIDLPNLVVLFPHEQARGKDAIPETVLNQSAPLTYQYLSRYRDKLEERGSKQEYRSNGPFYSLWRVGPYTFAPFKVVWPEIGELRAAVISTAPTPWGEEKMIVPEGKVNFIACDTEDEAHFVCGFLNTPIVRRAYEKLSSQIGRPVRLPFKLPKYNAKKWTHRAIAAVSKAAHQGKVQDPERLLERLLKRIIPH